MKRYALLLLLGLCTACGSYKAVRPDAPLAVVAEAQNNLAARYATGTGVTRDMAKAKYWYGKAAAQGNKQAAYTLQQLEALEKNNGSLKTQMLNEAQKTLPNKK